MNTYVLSIKDRDTGEWIEIPAIKGAIGPKGDPGDPGYSPTVSVSDIEGGHRVTITDAGGEHAFDVMDGQGGGDHNQLTNRDEANQHPMSAITGLQTVLNGKQPIGDYATSGELDALADIVGGKQEEIADLTTIRSGAALGATAVQPETGKGLFSGDYNDLTNQPTIPSAVTESTVSGWGFTKNTGTYSKPSAGIPKTDLASAVQTSLGLADTALQSHQDISGKQDKAISDPGNYFTTDTVEGALQEIGAELNNLPDIPETENAQEIAVDSEVTEGSNNLITSGAVAAAVAGGGGGDDESAELEYITSVTVSEEDVNSVEFSLDKDGLPFSLTKFAIVMGSTQTPSDFWNYGATSCYTGNSNTRLFINKDELPRDFPSFYNIGAHGTASRHYKWFFEKKNGRWFVITAPSGTAWSSSSINDVHAMFSGHAYSKAKEIAINLISSSVYIKPGVTIGLFGIRG